MRGIPQHAAFMIMAWSRSDGRWIRLQIKDATSVASIVSPRRVLPWPSGVSRPTSPLGGQRADEAAAPILPVLPWPSGVSRPTSPLGVATAPGSIIATSGDRVENPRVESDGSGPMYASK